MNIEKAIEVQDVFMKFDLHKERVDTLKEYVIKKIKNEIEVKGEFYALQDVTFKVKKGESVALVGKNGSGKSTMLKIISGIYKPTQGSVKVHGSIAPLLELGAGFDSNLTARENIYLNGAILGYDRKFMNEKYEEILDFAELNDFIDVPVKNFSSGMTARLGFSIATMVKPDILVVDEILSVGDFDFKRKCESRMAELMDGGTTVFLVSHAMEQVLKICERAIWIEKGRIVLDGEVGAVSREYSKS